MRYFLDTEFSERGGKVPTIDLISIGIVTEDGKREFYAESSEFDEAQCSDWVKENVLPKLGPKYRRSTRANIKKALLEFVDTDLSLPEFWAYYADYDWIVFCWLFGTMMDLPEGYPSLCMDLQQWWVMAKKPDVKPPDPVGEHNALADARWNLELYKSLREYVNQRGY